MFDCGICSAFRGCVHVDCVVVVVKDSVFLVASGRRLCSEVM